MDYKKAKAIIINTLTLAKTVDDYDFSYEDHELMTKFVVTHADVGEIGFFFLYDESNEEGDYRYPFSLEYHHAAHSASKKEKKDPQLFQQKQGLFRPVLINVINHFKVYIDHIKLRDLTEQIQKQVEIEQGRVNELKQFEASRLAKERTSLMKQLQKYYDKLHHFQEQEAKAGLLIPFEIKDGKAETERKIEELKTGLQELDKRIINGESDAA